MGHSLAECSVIISKTKPLVAKATTSRARTDDNRFGAAFMGVSALRRNLDDEHARQVQGRAFDASGPSLNAVKRTEDSLEVEEYQTRLTFLCS
jgi:hypothetical protein